MQLPFNQKTMGSELSKFNGTAMLGGVTLNGFELFSTAISEQQKLEEEIRLNFEEPSHNARIKTKC